jgi:hypothetical protein
MFTLLEIWIFMFYNLTTNVQSLSHFYKTYSYRQLWFFLRREPYYHKIQYSKTPKFDVAAAVLGVVSGAFLGYLSLSSLGSAGADLTDMSVLFWYFFLSYRTVWLVIYLSKECSSFFYNPIVCFLWVFFFNVIYFFKILFHYQS